MTTPKRPVRRRKPKPPTEVAAELLLAPETPAEAAIRKESAYHAHFYSAAELRPEPEPTVFLVDGVLTAGTYGPLGGEKKTLKSYTMDALMLSVASGKDFLGHFPVSHSGPVVSFIGEGGTKPYRRRRNRLAYTMGISPEELDELPIWTTFDTHPIGSKEFTDDIKRVLDQVQPLLIGVDSLYNFHPSDIKNAGDMYERGRMLSDLSDLVKGEATLILADHFRKTGTSDLDLDSIAQAGMGPWADSWLLQQHREQARPDLGQFWLRSQFGSREWGAAEYEIDWNIGRFDVVTGQFDGPIAYSVKPVDFTAGRKRSGSGESMDDLGAVILQIIDDKPFELSKTDVLAVVGGDAARRRKAFATLEEAGVIVVKNVPTKTADGREVGLPRVGRSEPTKALLKRPGRR